MHHWHWHVYRLYFFLTFFSFSIPFIYSLLYSTYTTGAGDYYKVTYLASDERSMSNVKDYDDEQVSSSSS